MKFDPRQVSQYVQKFNKQLASLKIFFTKYRENCQLSTKNIMEMNQELKKNTKAINYDTSFVRKINQFAYNGEEKQSNQEMTQFLEFKVFSWLEICDKILSDLNQKMRVIDSKFQKKQISDKEIADFKAFLIQTIYSYEQNKQAIVTHFSLMQINANSLLLQSLTNKILNLNS